MYGDDGNDLSWLGPLMQQDPSLQPQTKKSVLSVGGFDQAQVEGPTNGLHPDMFAPRQASSPDQGQAPPGQKSDVFSPRQRAMQDVPPEIYQPNYVEVPKANAASKISRFASGRMGPLAASIFAASSNDQDISAAQAHNALEQEKVKNSLEQRKEWDTAHYARNLYNNAQREIVRGQDGKLHYATRDMLGNLNVQPDEAVDPRIETANTNAASRERVAAANNVSKETIAGWADDARRDVASTQAGASRYGADQRRAGEENAATTRANAPARSGAAPKDPNADVNAFERNLRQKLYASNGGKAPTPEQDDAIQQQVNSYRVSTRGRGAGIVPGGNKPKPPAATGQPQLKPNWRYRINGQVVTTDANGNIKQ